MTQVLMELTLSKQVMTILCAKRLDPEGQGATGPTVGGQRDAGS